LQNLADVTSLLGEYEASTELAKEALTVSEEIGDRWTMESVLNNLGVDQFEAKGDTEDEILKQVAEHAASAHGITEVTPELVEKARENKEDA